MDTVVSGLLRFSNKSAKSLVVILILASIAMGSIFHEYLTDQKYRRAWEWNDIRHETITIAALAAIGGFVAGQLKKTTATAQL